MGTNYYLCPNRCSHCGRTDEKKHIGKSSAGWAFALHVYPDDGIKDLDDWIPLFLAKTNHIEDEYGREISHFMMLDLIRDRQAIGRDWDKVPSMYSSWEDFHEKNFSEQGPKGLVRSRIDKLRCIGHGEGTWDLMIGEFS